ncbi:MAG: hypothetical protein WDN75_15445 [Bacteroidota bacterium]
MGNPKKREIISIKGYFKRARIFGYLMIAVLIIAILFYLLGYSLD